jgi:hypothetical protein
MKTIGFILVGVMLVLVLGAGYPLTSRVMPYQTLHSVAALATTPDTDLAATTGYGVITEATVPSGAIDISKGAGGIESESNGVILCVHATTAAEDDTVTQKIYGINVGGAPQLIASVVWTIGTARADGSTATFLWAESAAVTSTHLTDISTASPTNGVGSISFDATGYRYIYGLFTADSGDPATVTCLYRGY